MICTGVFWAQTTKRCFLVRGTETTIYNSCYLFCLARSCDTNYTSVVHKIVYLLTIFSHICLTLNTFPWNCNYQRSSFMFKSPYQKILK